MPMPELPDTGAPNGGPAPVESLPAPKMEAMGAAFQNGLGRTLGISLEGSVIGKLRGGAFVPYDDAKAEMEAEGYDSHVLPKAGLSRGELDTIISQQSKLKQNDAIVSQSHLSGFTAGAMGFAGASLDPLFIGAGPVLGRLGLAAKGLTLPGRLAAGGAEGAVIGGTYDVVLQHFGNAPGDRDIGTDQVVKDSAFMALGGAVLHGAFGPRAKPLEQRMQVLIDHKSFLQDNFPGIAITSDVRTAAHNKAIGGALNSMHLSAEAVDFVLPKGMAAAEAKAMIQRKGLPITEWLIEKKGDPHSTGDHIHWGWGEKGRERFGSGDPNRPSLISMDWTQIGDPNALPDQAAHALTAASVDASPTTDALKGVGLEAMMKNRGKLGPTSPIWWDTRPAGLDERYMTRFGGDMEPAGNRVFDEDYMRRFGGQTEPVPRQGHVPADAMEQAARFTPDHRGPASRLASDEHPQGTEHLPPGYRPPLTPDQQADFDLALKRRFGVGTSYGPSQPLEPGSILTAPKPNEAAIEKATASPMLANQGPTVEAALSTDHADLKASADAAVAEAKARPAPEGAEQHPVDAHLEAAEESLHNQGYSDDMVKAIGAAVRCTLVNGLG